MEHYDFEILKGDEIITVARSVALPDPRGAWSRVTELAKNVDKPGCLIRVTNAAGEVVVLVSVAAVRARSMNTGVDA